MSRDSAYLVKVATAKIAPNDAGPGFGFAANLRWFLTEQKKILAFDEGVFIFMLSLALVLDILTPMLWVFAASQLYYGLYRSWQHGRRSATTTKRRFKSRPAFCACGPQNLP